MAQPKIIIIQKPGETISRRKMKRYEKVAREWDKKPKEKKLSRRDRKRIERERKETLENLARSFKKRKKPERKKSKPKKGLLKAAWSDAKKKGGKSYGKRKERASKGGWGLSLGGYKF